MSSTKHLGRRVADVTVQRSYEQWCPIAVGLDLLGDRWTLLIVRELSFGDQRFTDLRHALPGLAPNLLTDRLRALVEMGLVTTAELPPPAARSVYRLTDEGRAATPVLRALARFGARHLAGEPSPAMDAFRAAAALLVPWYRPEAEPSGSAGSATSAGRAGPRRARLVVTSVTRPEPTAVDLTLARPIELRHAAPDDDTDPEVVLTTTVEALAAARRDGTPLPHEPIGTKRHVAAFREMFTL